MKNLDEEVSSMIETKGSDKFPVTGVFDYFRRIDKLKRETDWKALSLPEEVYMRQIRTEKSWLVCLNVFYLGALASGATILYNTFF